MTRTGIIAACWILGGATAWGCSATTPGGTAGAAARARTGMNAAAHIKVALPEATKRDTNPPTITGLWMKTYTIQGEVVDMGFDTFNADGNEMIVDISPPVSDNVCTGIWQQTGAFTYTLKHLSWVFDDSGKVNGMVVFQETLTLSRDGNSFTGTSTIFGYDLDGNPLGPPEGPATITGTRIKPV